MKTTSVGAKKINELNPNQPNLFKSDSKFSSMSYAGGNEIVDKTQSMNKTIMEKLKSIHPESKFSIGSTNRNLHLYAPQADVLDGRLRICYIAGDEDSIIISEYYNPRGDKYSALFKILADELYSNGVQSIINSKNGISFKIKEDKMNIFIASCQEVIKLLENNCLVFTRSNETFSINRKEKGEKTDFYYYKFYYKKKNVINPYKTIAEEISNQNNLIDLDKIIDKLSNLTTLAQNKKNELDTIMNI